MNEEKKNVKIYKKMYSNLFEIILRKSYVGSNSWKQKLLTINKFIDKVCSMPYG